MPHYQLRHDSEYATEAVNGKWFVHGSHNPSGPREARFGYGYTITNLRSGRFVRIYATREEFASPYRETALGAGDFPVFGKPLSEVFDYLETAEFRETFKRCARRD